MDNLMEVGSRRMEQNSIPPTQWISSYKPYSYVQLDQWRPCSGRHSSTKIISSTEKMVNTKSIHHNANIIDEPVNSSFSVPKLSPRSLGIVLSPVVPELSKRSMETTTTTNRVPTRSQGRTPQITMNLPLPSATTSTGATHNTNT
jgi:hypothetical protein